MRGKIYFLTNKSMPNLLKVGYTTGPIEERLAQLNSTGVPLPFETEAIFSVENPEFVEKQIHSLLDKYRLSKNREFFQLSLSIALQESFQLIIDSLVSDIGLSDSQACEEGPTHGLPEENVILLQCLAGHNRNAGYPIYKLTDVIDESLLEIENRFANLKNMGLVEEKRSREEWMGSIWRITSKGVKFIFDHGLVEDYMIERKRHLWP